MSGYFTKGLFRIYLGDYLGYFTLLENLLSFDICIFVNLLLFLQLTLLNLFLYI